MNPYDSSERINSYFIEQVKDYAIYATDTNGIVTTWNAGVERVKGYKAEELIGQFYGILFPDEYQQAGKPEDELKKALENGVYEAEEWRKKKDGSLFWASVTLTPIFSDEGHHVGYTKVTGDITKQKKLQDQLAERQQEALDHKNTELHKVNQDLDNFIYTASHDLRSPITNIEGLMKFLKDELAEAGALSSDMEEILHRVIDSVNRFKQTIEDLTEITSLNKGLGEAQTEEIINLQEVYEQVAKELETNNNHKTCFIQADFKVHQLKFSKNQLKSIFHNLLSNAIKFQSPDRECIINIHTFLKDPYVVLCIKDNGLGINKRQQDNLYTMFRRFHDHVEGTGIGLYMVKRIIENAGGKIEVESEEGKGTEFKLYFKAAV